MFITLGAFGSNVVADRFLDIVQDNEICLLLLTKMRRDARCAKLAARLRVKKGQHFIVTTPKSECIVEDISPLPLGGMREASI